MAGKARRYITFSVTDAEYELIKKAVAKEGGQDLAPFCRENVLGIVDIIVNDPSFVIAPCESCGHTNGRAIKKVQKE